MSQPDIKYINLQKKTSTLNYQFDKRITYEAHSEPSEGLTAYVDKTSYDALQEQFDAMKKRIATRSEA